MNVKLQITNVVNGFLFDFFFSSDFCEYVSLNGFLSCAEELLLYIRTYKHIMFVPLFADDKARRIDLQDRVENGKK